MEIIRALFSNHWLVCAFLGWLFAQLIKGVLDAVRNRKFDISRFFGAGGMPSSHSSLVASLTMIIALTKGLDCAEFALALVFAFVVIYDSCGVRYESGQQAKLINQIIASMKSADQEAGEQKLKEFLGHTKLQTTAGTLLGILIATLYYFIVKPY